MLGFSVSKVAVPSIFRLLFVECLSNVLFEIAAVKGFVFKDATVKFTCSYPCHSTFLCVLGVYGLARCRSE